MDVGLWTAYKPAFGTDRFFTLIINIHVAKSEVARAIFLIHPITIFITAPANDLMTPMQLID